MAGFIRIRNWEKWQSYRKDRGQPPWIKIHRCVMRNAEWVSLSDAERGQLVAMWLLAADNDGAIPASPDLIRKLCYLDNSPDINKFKELGFICQDDVNTAPTRRQDDSPETETETETEEETEKNYMSSSAVPNIDHSGCFPETLPPDDEVPAPDDPPLNPDPPLQPETKAGNQNASQNIKAVFEYWKSTLDHPKARLDDKRKQKIKARLKDGYTVEDLKAACDGCRASPYHQGENDRGAVYDDIELICRDGKHVDQFIKLARDPTARMISAKGRQARRNGEIWLEMRKRQQQAQEAWYEQRA